MLVEMIVVYKRKGPIVLPSSVASTEREGEKGGGKKRKKFQARGWSVQISSLQRKKKGGGKGRKRGPTERRNGEGGKRGGLNVPSRFNTYFFHRMSLLWCLCNQLGGGRGKGIFGFGYTSARGGSGLAGGGTYTMKK